MKNPFKAILNYYTCSLKLQTKFLISHLVLILIPTLVVATFFYQRFYTIIVDNTITSEQAIAAQTANALDATLSQITYTATSILDGNAITNLLSYSPGSEKESAFDRVLSDNAYRSIAGLIDRDLISSIRVYCDDSLGNPYRFNTNAENIFQPVSKIASTLWYGSLASSDENSMFCPSIYLSPSEIRNSGDLAYVCKIANPNYPDQIAGYLAIYFKNERIDSILQKDITLNNSVTYIVNQKDHPVSTSDATLSGAYFTDFNTLKNTVSSPGLFETQTYLNDSVYIGYWQLTHSDWNMVSVVPQNSLTEKGRQLILDYVGIYSIFLVLAFVLALLLSRSIVKRISSVIKKMKSVQTGRLIQVHQQPYEHDEIGDLVITYNYLTNEITDLLAKQQQAATDLRLAEFRALQSQINPHFLYNTLDMINWLSLSDKKEELSEAIHSLSRFYKLTLRKHDEIIPIELELEHVSLFVQIQNLRYENRIDFLIDVPLNICDYYIPRLTLQPIVENAIQHGLFMQNQPTGNIVITGWLDSDDVVITVSDNGIGMSPEQMQTILLGEDKNNGKSNIGIYNTHLRLSLLYGQKYGLSYSSTIDQGTEVTIRIPAV